MSLPPPPLLPLPLLLLLQPMVLFWFRSWRCEWGVSARVCVPPTVDPLGLGTRAVVFASGTAHTFRPTKHGERRCVHFLWHGPFRKEVAFGRGDHNAWHLGHYFLGAGPTDFITRKRECGGQFVSAPTEARGLLRQRDSYCRSTEQGLFERAAGLS